ncbi:hypothetical protein ACKUSY_16290 [Myroides odoratus]
MKLKIDEWIENNKFSMNVNLLLKDSSLCYKAGANRASLLFSYLGFLTILKERIISANMPQNYTEGDWNNLISKINNEDKWEEAIFDSTQQKTKIDQATNKIIKDSIFSIKDDIREQIKYWKNRRNDCAHFKENNIDYYHVESFWAFMESNLSKITVEGGVNTLINKIKDHFNPTLTPPNKDLSHLVMDIEHSIEPTKLAEFWDSYIIPIDLDIRLSTTRKKFLKECFRISSDVVKESIVKKLKDSIYYMIDFLDSYPELVLNFNFNSQEVRKLWKVDIRKSNNVIVLYSSLLRNALIPRAEIIEANEAIINHIKDYSPSAIDHKTMESNNFFNTFKSEILGNSNFVGFNSYLWVNARADLISGIIKNYPADKEILIKLSEHYEQAYNSEWLLKKFDYSVENGDSFINAYKTIKESENIDIPTNLEKYFT